MSAKRLNLRNPLVIAGVFVLLAVVTVINLHTFGVCLLRTDTGTVSRSVMPPAPVDLQLASESLTDRSLSLPPPPLENPQLERDPFLDERVVRDAASPPVTKAVKKRTRTKPLVCSAILLGGKRPTALINGKAYGPDDVVGSYRVAEITATRVLLKKANGQVLTLLAAPELATSGSYKVVTSNQVPAERSATRMIDHR